MRALRTAIVVAALVLAASPAAAERIVASLSTHRVMITSSFSGLDLVLFGSVERDAQTQPRRSGYDLVVTVTGPRQALVTRRRERVFGIWVNVDSETFADVPSYLAVLSSKPLEAIASGDTLRRYQIGLRRTFLPLQSQPEVSQVGRDTPFRAALFRLREQQGLYLENTGGVTFLTPTLFRTTIPLPAEIVTGSYEVDLKLFADGNMVGRANSAFEIAKAGFEQFVANSAISHGLLYGIVTVMMALVTGWLASVVFRRD